MHLTTYIRIKCLLFKEFLYYFSILLLIFSPLLILSLIMTILLDFHCPLFIQERSGLNGKSIYTKLKTMRSSGIINKLPC